MKTTRRQPHNKIQQKVPARRRHSIKITTKRIINSRHLILLILATPISASAEYSHLALINFPPPFPQSQSGVIGSSSAPLPGITSYERRYAKGGYLAETKIEFTASPIASLSIYSQAASPGASAMNMLAEGRMEYTFEVFGAPLTSIPTDFSGVFKAHQTGRNRSINNLANIEISESTTGEKRSSNFGLEFISSRFKEKSYPVFLLGTSSPTYQYTQPDEDTIVGKFMGSINLTTDKYGRAQGSVLLISRTVLSATSDTLKAYSFIDPHLEINPSFLISNPNTSLRIFDGVGNSILAVPEASTLSLSIFGIAVIFIRKAKKFVALLQFGSRSGFA